MYVPDWVMTVLIALAALTITFAAFVVGRRKDREKKLISETTEKVEVKSLIENLGRQITEMDRNTTAALARMESQQGNVEKIVQDHEKRIYALEINK
jgi:predicted membrane protein